MTRVRIIHLASKRFKIEIKILHQPLVEIKKIKFSDFIPDDRIGSLSFNENTWVP